MQSKGCRAFENRAKTKSEMVREGLRFQKKISQISHQKGFESKWSRQETGRRFLVRANPNRQMKQRERRKEENMKRIQTLSDLENLRGANATPMELIKAIEHDFLAIYESEGNEVYLLEFYLPPWQALFLLEPGDDVLGKLDNSLALEYVEKLELEEMAYYRCALRNEHDLQLYYSQVGIHEKSIENWLKKQAE